ncbi:MAG: hypothetical protein IPF99_31350 [Deltaproteobacteria bacterium]|jgi:hypothetical protein|nr:hypothetical protein [Deltaproteobacteria bacterium]MDO9019345.1 hypothetical protein [Myxococcales bacterium]MDP3216164.1 hypothetical protein [Deltaproteobacteria bacterium]
MEATTPEPSPSWRRGWSYTALKCLVLTAALMGVGALALHLLLATVAPPWYVPRPVFEWLMENVRPYALWLGAALGGFVGFLGSLGVVVFDARRGRLKRVP